VQETSVAPAQETPAAPVQETPAMASAPAQDSAPVVPSGSENGAARSDSETVKNMLHIQYGQFRLDLPNDIDIDPVARILKEIQDRLK
jgi:hypothetical protein